MTTTRPKIDEIPGDVTEELVWYKKNFPVGSHWISSGDKTPYEILSYEGGSLFNFAKIRLQDGTLTTWMVWFLNTDSPA